MLRTGSAQAVRFRAGERIPRAGQNVGGRTLARICRGTSYLSVLVFFDVLFMECVASGGSLYLSNASVANLLTGGRSSRSTRGSARTDASCRSLLTLPRAGGRHAGDRHRSSREGKVCWGRHEGGVYIQNILKQRVWNSCVDS